MADKRRFQNEGRTHNVRGDGGLNVAQQGAFDTMMALLKQYDLEALGGVLMGLIKDGIKGAALNLALQDTKEWKTRFAGNEMLKKKGLPVLGVDEYLATERSYAQIMKDAGLPTGFWDDHADKAVWIGNAVSADELRERVAMYADFAKRDDPAIIAQLKSMGLTEGDILAHFMDPKRARPLIQQKYQQTLIGAAARRTGLVSDNDYLKHLADLGVSEQQAAQGYGLISENLGTVNKLAEIYGEDYDQSDFEKEVFEQNGGATRKRKRLASQERAAFSGSSGVGQGSLTRSSGGQY